MADRPPAYMGNINPQTGLPYTAADYHGSIPAIANAYQNDPRTKLAASAIAQGGAGTPVAQGAWGVPDGLAHVAQAVAGALAQKSNDKRYAQREQQYRGGMMDSLGVPDMPNAVASALMPPPGAPIAPPASSPGAMPGGMTPPAGGMVPPEGGMAPPPVPPPSMVGSGAGGLPIGAMPPPPPGAPPPGMPHMGAARPGNGMLPGGATTGGPAQMSASSIDGGPSPGFLGAKQGGLNSLALYRTGIVPIEGGTDPRTGAFRTSPKGAIGPGQIMPGTAPEAARLAGVPYDANKLHTDPDYNNTLGAAYYDSKLQEFGDPLKAAAAYNAGSGSVRRAVRRAARDGSDWRDKLPAETQTYVANFMQKTGIGSNGQPMTAAPIASAHNEPVPDALEMPTARPEAPEVPPAVQSQRMAIARRMLASNNPDLVALAQTYIDKGLTENHDADMAHNAQQFDRQNLGYTSDLNNDNAARSDVRAQRAADRTAAQTRNYASGERVATEQFTAGQNAADRTKDWGIQRFQQANENARQSQQLAQQDRQFNIGQANETERTKLVIEGKRQTEQEKKTNQRNVFFSSPTGLKMQKDLGDEMNTNDDAIGKYRRFIELNRKHSTGGIIGGLPGVGTVRGMTDAEVREMNSIANDTTLANLGGSLGVAISDGDRNFISAANISTSAPEGANTAVASARIKALVRKNDYLNSFAMAQADGTQTSFINDFRKYASEVSVRNPGDYISFDEWKDYHARKGAK